VRIAYDGVPLVGDRFGIGHYTDHLIRAVTRVDADTRAVVVGPWPVNPLRPMPSLSFAEPNVQIPRPGLATRVRRRLRELVGAPATLEALVGPVDVFHATNFLLTHPVERARRVVTVHDLTVLLFPQWHPAKRLREMRVGLPVSAAVADHIIAVSQATKDDVVKHLAIEPARVTVVPLAVDGSFHPLPRADVETALAPLGLVPGGYLLFLGTREPRKNLARLLDAMTVMGAEVGPLVLAGADGWGTDDLRPRIAALGRQGRVRALGYVPEALRPSLLCGARVFVYPSLYEGFGLPPLEAMACGTPVITSNVSALPETVGDAALLVDPTDVDALATAIRRLWRDEALRADLQARGLTRARDFSWERTARLTLAVYTTVLRA
jgi:glycosyltransferase involved in cell wall biosynthesis